MVGAHLGRDAGDPEARDRADLREAYERGRTDERAGRRRHPVLMTLTFIVAAVGLALLALAAAYGSFGTAGDVVDRTIAQVANRAEPRVREAATDAGRSLREVGQTDSAQPPDVAG